MEFFRHTFHAECIRQWIDKKPICPLCRVELRSGDEEERTNSNRGAIPYNPPSLPQNRNGRN